MNFGLSHPLTRNALSKVHTKKTTLSTSTLCIKNDQPKRNVQLIIHNGKAIKSHFLYEHKTIKFERF